MRLVTIGPICLLALILTLGGCKESNKEASQESAAPASGSKLSPEQLKPAYGDMFVSGTIGDASVLLPVLASDSASFEITSLIFDGLLKYDKNLQLEPDLAEKWEISEDKLKIRFHLRKGVKWQDGKPFTSKDVEFTWKVYVNPKTPTAYATDYLRVKEFRVIDDHTIEIIYENPYAPALGSWASLSVLPSHLFDGVDDIAKSPLTRKPVGTGAFIFKEWQTQEKIVVDANPNYFQGRPYISRVIKRVIPDLATQFLELKAGKIDSMGLTPMQFVRQTSGQWWDANYKKYKYLFNGYTYLGFNLLDKRFRDKRVRYAITHAIDRKKIVEGVLLGLGEVAHTPYKPDTYWHNPNVMKLEYDPEKAKRLLAEAGWIDTDGDGILDKDGKPFEFTIITNQGNEQRQKAATMIQSDLKKVGIKVNIRVYEWAAFLKNFINKKDFEAVVLAWSIGIDPNQIEIWNSTRTAEHQLNFISYNNPEVDRLLELGVSTFDPAERKKYYDRFQEVLAEDQPYTFLWVPYSLPAVSSRFHGIDPGPAGISYNFEKWYVPKPLQRYEIQP